MDKIRAEDDRRKAMVDAVCKEPGCDNPRYRKTGVCYGHFRARQKELKAGEKGSEQIRPACCSHCPAMHDGPYSYESGCSLGLWHRSRVRKEDPPATCDFAIPLKMVAEDPQGWKLLVVEETVYRAMMRGNGIGAARGEE